MIGIGLGLWPIALSQGGAYLPAAASFGGRPVSGSERYLQSARPTCTRAGPAYAKNKAGDWVSFAADELRITDKGLALPEPAATNVVQSSGFDSAVVATNTMPTGWTKTVNGGSVDVVEKVTEGGLPCIGIRFSGAFSANPAIRLQPTLAASATLGQSWEATAEYRIDDGSIDNVYAIAIILGERNSGGSTIAFTNIEGAPSDVWQQMSGGRVISEATTVAVTSILTLQVIAGQPVDITFLFRNIACGQGPLGSPIITPTGASGSRAAESVVITGPAGETDLYLLLDDLTEVVVTGWNTGEALPTNLTPNKHIERFADVPLWSFASMFWDDFNRADGAIGTSGSGKLWQQVSANGDARVLASIQSNKLVAADRATGSGPTASYSVINLNRNITSMRAKIDFSPDASGEPAVALIITPTLTLDSIDYILGRNGEPGSIHAVFTRIEAKVGFYSGDILSELATFNYSDMVKAAGPYDVGLDVVGDTCTLFGPYGQSAIRVDSRFIAFAGSYGTWEHFWSSSPISCKPRFYRVWAR